MSGIIDTVGSRSGIVGSDVYPAGHVIQTKTTVSTGQVTFPNTNNSWSDIVPAAAITLTNSANAVLISVEYSLVIGGGNYPAIKVAIWWSISGGSQNQGLVNHFTAYNGSGQENDYLVEPILYYQLPATGAELTYRLVGTNTTGSSFSGTYTGYASPAWAGHDSNMILQEIQV
jgi:hypothetical protein